MRDGGVGGGGPGVGVGGGRVLIRPVVRSVGSDEHSMKTTAREWRPEG